MIAIPPVPLAPAGPPRRSSSRPVGPATLRIRALEELLTLPPLEEWLAGSVVASATDGDGKSGDRDFAAVKEFIEEHLAEPFDVSELSRRANLTRPHFTRVFTEQEGVPPWTYVLDRRVRRAAELLEEGMPPSEVALESGFCDQSHLTRVFRRATGTTPGEFQRDRTNVQDPEDEGD